MFCRKCGVQLDDSATFCSSCGERQIVVTEATVVPPQPVESTEIPATAETTSAVDVEAEPEITVEAEPEAAVEAEPTKKEIDKRFVGKTCAYCKTEITEDDEITVCSACETALHKSCWVENGGCATFGCTGKPEGTVICRVCGAEMSAEQAFCAKCGSVKAASEEPAAPAVAQVNSSVCPGCGCALEPQQKYCNQCGRQLTVAFENNASVQSSIDAYNSSVATKTKTGKNKVIMIVALLAIAGIVAAFLVNSARVKAAEEYMSKVEDFSALCWSAGGDLEDVGNDIQDYWNKYIVTYGTKVYYQGHYMYSINDAVKYALSDNSSKVNSIKSEWSSIQSLYKELKDVPKNNSELAAVFEDVKDVYEAFEDMYDCVIDVSGNYTTYKTHFGDCDTALADALKELDENLE